MALNRAYQKPAAPRTAHPMRTAAAKLPPRRLVSGGDSSIGLILALAFCAPFLAAQEAPENLAKLVAHRETETETERNEYMYRQTVTLQELDEKGGMRGEYRETRDIIFSPKHERTE